MNANVKTKTKFELVQINAQLATENSDLRHRVSQLQMDLEIARRMKDRSIKKDEASNPVIVPSGTVPAMLREQANLFSDDRRKS